MQSKKHTRHGVTGVKGYLYGVANGVSEVAIEKLINGVPGISNIDELGNTPFKAFAKSALSEGIEEWTQNYISYGLKGGFDVPADFEKMNADGVKSFFMGALTSSIMNGGAVAIKSVGQTMTLTTAELSEFVNNGKFDDKALIQALIGNQVSEYNNIPFQEKKVQSQELMINAIRDEGLGEYVSEEQINRIFEEKVVVLGDTKAVSEMYKEKSKNPKAGDVLGFYSSIDDKIWVSEDISTFTIVHEALHAINQGIPGRGINEAFTDYFANRITKNYSASAYTGTANIAENINEILEQSGYGHVAAESYFTDKSDGLKNLLNSLTYQGYYETINNKMEVVHDWQANSDKKSAKTYTELYKLQQKLYDKTIGKNQQKSDNWLQSFIDKLGKNQQNNNEMQDINGNERIISIKTIEIILASEEVRTKNGIQGVAEYINENQIANIAVGTDGVTIRAEDYLNSYLDIQNIAAIQDAKHGSGTGLVSLEQYLAEGANGERITEDNGARDLITKIPAGLIDSYINIQKDIQKRLREQAGNAR